MKTKKLEGYGITGMSITLNMADVVAVSNLVASIEEKNRLIATLAKSDEALINAGMDPEECNDVACIDEVEEMGFATRAEIIKAIEEVDKKLENKDAMILTFLKKLAIDTEPATIFE